eukprot:TRINITY_DN29712_c0_g1_i1.p1 TRINITY_DN29712_c0_g1~~TRINITY_DN29712_c0_g1_i1.p1  ORF type:complete len:344 (+),score=135.36 TRINITY_DN29712_c0_g1_i1:74-1033(+)
MTERKKVAAAVDELAATVAALEERRAAGKWDWGLARQYDEALQKVNSDLRGRVAKLRRRADEPAETRTFGPQTTAQVHAMCAQFQGVSQRLSRVGDWIHAEQRAAAAACGDSSPLLQAELGPGRFWVLGSGAGAANFAAAMLERTEDPLVWHCTVRGPRFSPFYGGEWRLKLELPSAEQLGAGEKPLVRQSGPMLPHYAAERGSEGRVDLGEAAWGQPPLVSNWVRALRRSMIRPLEAGMAPGQGVHRGLRDLPRYEASARRSVHDARSGSPGRAFLRTFLLAAERRQLLPDGIAEHALLTFMLPVPPPVFFVPTATLS